MNKDDLIIIKPMFNFHNEENANKARQMMLKQKKEGIILLPFGYDVVVMPEDVEVKLGPDKDERKFIHNAAVYICLADKEGRAGESDRIAQILYDRAYRKGFEAGKKEGTVKIKEVEVPEKHYTQEEIDGWNGGGA